MWGAPDNVGTRKSAGSSVPDCVQMAVARTAANIAAHEYVNITLVLGASINPLGSPVLMYDKLQVTVRAQR